MTSQLSLTPEILVPRIGDYLVEQGYLTPEQLVQALQTQKEYRRKGKTILLGDLLLELHLIDRTSLDQVITEQIIQLRNALEESNRTLENRVNQRTQELQEALIKLADLDKLKSNIIANISHELRTPLTHIKGYQELLLAGAMGPLNPDQDSTLKTIRRSTERLEHLIEDLINFSQMSEGDVALRLVDLDVKRMITTVSKHSIAKAEEKKIDFKIKEPDELVSIRADEEKITWVMNQLLDNAIKFTPEKGHVNLIVEKNDLGIRICVEDSGIGIPADKMEEIFQPFHQLDGSSTRRYGGTGLGLSLVRQIVEAHHSHITVVSEPGRFTRFSFSLPSIPPGKTNHA